MGKIIDKQEIGTWNEKGEWKVESNENFGYYVGREWQVKNENENENEKKFVSLTKDGVILVNLSSTSIIIRSLLIIIWIVGYVSSVPQFGGRSYKKKNQVVANKKEKKKIEIAHMSLAQLALVCYCG